MADLGSMLFEGMMESIYDKKRKLNPIYTGEEIKGPGDVPYNYAGDPSAAIKKYGTGYYARPSVWNWMLAPDGARATTSFNRQIEQAPVVEDQRTALYQKHEPLRRAVDFGIQLGQIPQLGDANRKQEELTDAQRHKLAQQKRIERAQNYLALSRPDLYRSAKDVSPEHATMWDAAYGDTVNPGQVGQGLRDIGANMGGAPAANAIGDINTAQQYATRSSDLMKDYALRRGLGIDTDKIFGEARATDLANRKTDAEIMLFPQRITAEKMALGQGLEQAPVEHEVRMGELRGTAAAQPYTNTQRLNEAQRGAGLSSVNLETLPTDADTLRRDAVFRNVVSAGGGVTPAQELTQPYRTTVSPDGNVTINDTDSPAGYQAKIMRDVYSKMVPKNATAVGADGKALPVPPAPPITTRSAAGTKAMNYLPRTTTATKPTGQTVTQTAKEATPEKQMTWEEVYAPVRDEIGKLKSPQVSAAIKTKVNDYILQELANIIQVPEQYVGSSNIPRSNVSILRDMLSDPDTAANIEKTVNSLPPQVLRDIQQRALKLAKASTAYGPN